MAEKFTLDELVAKTQQILDDTKYNLKNTRHPAKKRSIENAFAFWTAIHYHLDIYRSLLKDSTLS